MSPIKVFYRIHHHVVDSLTYNYGANYIVAAIVTYVIVRSGFDVLWFQFSVHHPWIFSAGFVSVIVGFLAPVLVPVALYVYGLFRKNFLSQLTALAVAQAAALGLFISSFIKVFTGRIPPGAFTNNTLFGGFQFGILRGGIFYGWPSSHTTIAFAMATAIVALYPHNRAVKICAFTYAFLIGLGVSVDIHWFSDFIAGALIGCAIGFAVGKGFKKLITI